MAEGVFRHVTRFGLSDADERFAEVDSCGTGAYHEGDSPDSRTMAVLREHGISQKYYDHAARKVRSSDYTTFDFIFAMDKDNLRNLEQSRDRLIRKGDIDKSKVGTIALWGSYGGKGAEEVIDPYYGGRNGFDVAYKQMVRFTEGFLAQLDSGKIQRSELRHTALDHRP